MRYSPDPDISEAVRKMLDGIGREINPYTRRHNTIGDVVLAIELVFGEAAAKAVRITLH
jgi:hypothetical protein